MKNARRLMYALMIGSMIAFAGGCNTMHGVGEDIEDGGEAIQDAAEDNGA